MMKNVSMNSSDYLHRADWWNPLDDEKKRVKCTLCPHRCIIGPGRYGRCKVRQNRDGILYSISYGRPVALHIDPVEKKPLYHFYPGESVFSIGTMGCNMSCDFCQNWTISQAGYGKIPSPETYSPEDIVQLTQEAGLRLIAFTYNEPTVYAEYMKDIAKIAVKKGIKTISVTNGFVTVDLIPDLYENVHAFNIDLKGFSNSFYRKYTGASFSEILETIKTIHALKKHLEITTLIIPGLNDSQEELRHEFEWILHNTGELTPLHLSAFYPAYKRQYHAPTSPKILVKARELALDIGLKYVYIGNISGVDNSTYCPNCHARIINRHSYRIQVEQERVCTCGRLIDVVTPDK
jgi:pyruvate formate lyase activating enzyme